MEDFKLRIAQLSKFKTYIYFNKNLCNYMHYFQENKVDSTTKL